jgi:hypothetical protein
MGWSGRATRDLGAVGWASGARRHEDGSPAGQDDAIAEAWFTTAGSGGACQNKHQRRKQQMALQPLPCWSKKTVCYEKPHNHIKIEFPILPLLAYGVASPFHLLIRVMLGI